MQQRWMVYRFVSFLTAVVVLIATIRSGGGTLEYFGTGVLHEEAPAVSSTQRGDARRPAAVDTVLLAPANAGASWNAEPGALAAGSAVVDSAHSSATRMIAAAASATGSIAAVIAAAAAAASKTPQLQMQKVIEQLDVVPNQTNPWIPQQVLLAPHLPHFRLPLASEDVGLEGMLEKDWEQLGADELAWLQDSSIFSMAVLDCAHHVPNVVRHRIGSDTPAQQEKGPEFQKGARLVAFAYNELSGATFLRAHSLASAVSLIPGWQAVIVTRNSRNLPPGLQVEFCVLVKHTSPLWKWCLGHGSRMLLLDVLDTATILKPLIFGKAPGVADVLLAPSASLAMIVRAANPSNTGKRLNGSFTGTPRAIPLYHQHSNTGYLADIRRTRVPYICRVGFHASSKYHSPKPESAKKLLHEVCASGRVWSYSLFISYSAAKGMHDLRCPGRSEEMTRTCEQLDEESLERRRRLPVNASGCYAEQSQHHNSTAMDLIDVVMLISEYNGAIQRMRPSTRFLHWASHGVPVIFWDFHSYMELTSAAGYVLPSGDLPLVDNAGLPASYILNQLNSSTRLRLRQIGLSLAAKYSVRGVAANLIDFYTRAESGGFTE